MLTFSLVRAFVPTSSMPAAYPCSTHRGSERSWRAESDGPGTPKNILCGFGSFLLNLFGQSLKVWPLGRCDGCLEVCVRCLEVTAFRSATRTDIRLLHGHTASTLDLAN